MHAEKQMDTNPRSSLAILKGLEKNIGEGRLSKMLSKKQYALWCLLLTQAQDKNGITQTSDSLIRIAVDYFEKKNDKPRLIKAYHYHGIICYNRGDSLQAQEYCLKVQDFYEQEVNKKTIHIQLSVIFIAVSIAASIALYLYSTKLKKENKEKNLRLEEIKLQVENQSKVVGEDKRVNALKADPLCQKIISNKAKVNDADWEALIGKIEEIYPDFTYNLKMLYPEIKEKDLRVCYLKKIDIPVNQLAGIFNKSSQGISNQRSRLYEKLTGKKGTAADLDKFLHDL
jgi:hypothetical protein